MQHVQVRFAFLLVLAGVFGCSDSKAPARTTDVGAATDDEAAVCSSECVTARAACGESCEDTQCSAECESSWRSCQQGCPGGLEAAQAKPIQPLGAPERGTGTDTGGLGNGTPYIGPGDGAGGIGGSSSDINPIYVTGSGGLNGISVNGSAGINGINTTATGGFGGSSF